MGFFKPIYKIELFFSSKIHISTLFTQDIYIAFYLLKWTYFNDVNGGRNILINSHFKRVLFISSGKKKQSKTEKDKKSWKKKKSDGSDSVKMTYHIQILWSLLNLNKTQASEILTVVAVILRKKVQKQSSGSVLQIVL